jgi:hypothetical protein
VKRVLLLLAAVPLAALAQEKSETRELVGQLGSRSALLILHSTRNPDDGSWQLAGEYVILATLQRRFIEGESSPEIGVTTLREGATPILFGRSPTGELRGTWRGGVFKGTRYASGGQERERFEFREEFPSLEGYTGSVRCETRGGRYASSLAYAIEAGKLQAFDWRSKVGPGGHACALASAEQQPMRGGIRLASGRCSVTLRELGDALWLSAENCAEHCGSQAYLEPMLIDRRGNCRLLRPDAR